MPAEMVRSVSASARVRISTSGLSGVAVDAQALAGGGRKDAPFEARLDGPERLRARRAERGDAVGDVAADVLGQFPQHGQAALGGELGEHQGDGLGVLVRRAPKRPRWGPGR